jgi:hypothetical protein
VPKQKPGFFLTLLFCVCLSLTASKSKAYSVLSHEALVDASWDKYIKPALLSKYPAATPDQLREAHAYVYGGCLMPDMGYYPFGSEYFTDLAHYVRTGDFVINLISESQTLDEYAFALGALCHYYGDTYGHALATNQTVPIVYPRIGKKFGKVVTYGEDPTAHSRVELAFDVLEVARGNYASQNYHDFIGFQVSKPLLERAFIKTYGGDINYVFSDLDLAIATFRWSVKSLMPTVTHSAWLLKKDEIKQSNPSANNRTFHYRMKRKAYYTEFGSSRQKPTFAQRIVAFIISILPNIGPFKALQFKPVGPEGEQKFIASFDTVLTHYHAALAQLQQNNLILADRDYDTGFLTLPGEYSLADETYSVLLGKLAEDKFKDLTPPLKQDILNFYRKTDTVQMAAKYPATWKKTYTNLQAMQAAAPIAIDSLKTDKGIYYKLNEPVTPPATGK